MEFIFDIETSGLPLKRKADGGNPYDNARIVSICWMIVDKETKNIVRQEYFIVKPENFVIPQRVINIHGISNEYANRYGKPIEFVLSRMQEALSEVDTIVAFNIDFDFNVARSEIARLEKPEFLADFESKKRLCCMKMAKEHLKSKTYVNLSKTYKLLIGYDMQNAHQAVSDVSCCYAIYKKMCF